MNKGDHIKIYRGGYWHHGIYVGDGYIVHFTNKVWVKRETSVRKTALKEFIGKDGEPVIVSNYDTSKMPDEVISTALRLIGSGGYNLFLNNCEHFAYYCRTGTKYDHSCEYADQIRNLIDDVFFTKVPIVRHVPVINNIAAFLIGIARVVIRQFIEKLLYRGLRFIQYMKGFNQVKLYSVFRAFVRR